MHNESLDQLHEDVRIGITKILEGKPTLVTNGTVMQYISKHMGRDYRLCAVGGAMSKVYDPRILKHQSSSKCLQHGTRGQGCGFGLYALKPL